MVSVNFHLTDFCNLRCKFCYAHFYNTQEKNKLQRDQILEILKKLQSEGFIKINFAGGEPFLHPLLGDLIHYAYKVGLKTSVVTNGTLVTKEWLDKYGHYLHWIGISCDSADEKIEKNLGRGSGTHVASTIHAFEMIKAFNTNNSKHRIRMKLNSVITSLNCQEDMKNFVIQCGVERWKIFQFLHIHGENDSVCDELAITNEQFSNFILKHKNLEKQNIGLVPENNDAMIESYIMMDSEGRFYQNKENFYKKSDPVLVAGISRALQQVGFSQEKFLSRGGLYSF